MERIAWSRGLILAVAGLILGLGGRIPAAHSAELAEPPVLASSNGVLDLLVVARAAPVVGFAPYATTGWVFDICRRPSNGANACPLVGANPNPYGGVRLKLQAGDLLKFRLVNKLPPVLDSKHASEPGEAYLALNPINIHTHGMLVSPRFPTVDNPTYGDNVFVTTLNPANGPLPPGSHIHGDVRVGYADYAIDIPAGHPSGLFWFHPHVHGVALNQVSAGMAGIITVGSISDYVCNNAPCQGFLSHLNVRHIILKDAQVLADGTLQDQEDPSFCNPAAAPGDPPWRGACAGASPSASGADYTGGKWFFTLNGQAYPGITMAPGGEIWRITTASGSASYTLALNLPSQNRNMVVQVLAVDGVAVALPPGLSPGAMANLGGGRFQLASCPPDVPPPPGLLSTPLCVSQMLMMPSSRVELWVAYRDTSGRLAAPPPGAQAVLKTLGRQTGPSGDSWPALDLASVTFGGSATPSAAPHALQVSSDPVALTRLASLSSKLAAANAAIGAEPDCTSLPLGHHRRIFFNVPTDNPNAFGLGYEEVDASGQPVPGTFRDVTPFDPDTPTVCVPLGPGNTATHERWELVNLAGEDHNFHIHQVKFSVIGRDVVTGAELPTSVQQDNAPLRHALGTCNSVADWRGGACLAYPVTVDIPFTIAGDFVYHCHILEHEDGGMMARIRVRASD